MKLRALKIVSLSGLMLLSPGVLFARNSAEFRQMRNEIQIFEGILKTALSNEFSHPMALVNEPKGSYLPGFGVNFTFLLNINRDEIVTPFGIRKMTASPRPRAEKIRMVRETVLKLLGDYGNALTQLNNDENFSVSAHLEDRTALVPSQKEEVLVFRVTKKALADFTSKKIDARQFREKVELIEY